ncbi:DUF4292 domain-containing protein [Pareuzebyella sediminis]|uniref:DUF4292 domain-containing protein n=1 Tax=Pareuzebyella sediminis TaxID=2607998 RepID=UPI0011EC13D2|nr:DUF4292 domain-containing protein [Pareuzebyella sediminis]
MRATVYRSVRRVILGAVFATLVLSCKSTNVLSDGTANAKLSAKMVIKEHYDKAIDFKTLSGKVRIDYSDGEASQGVSVSLRMEKDKAIWMSAPLGMVKAFITPNRVTFYNKLQNEYFDGDFSYLSKYLGTELNFEQVQSLLLGQALFNLKENRYDLAVVNGTYRLKPKRPLELFKVLFDIEPKNFRIASQQLSQPLRKRLLQVNYTDYQKIHKWILPQEITVAAIDGNQRNTIDIEYRNIEFNRPINFPYKIPKGFKEIVLEQDAR